MKDDIIRMARQAGLHLATDVNWMPIIGLEYAEKFAALVAAAEREACAKVCDVGVDTEHPTVKGHIMKNFGASSTLAAAIRARGNT